MAHPLAAQSFRERLEHVIAGTGLNQAAFARKIGMDRSTLSQLLAPENDRLPRAETLVAIAGGCGVSTDWLLGLSQREQIGAEIVETQLSIETLAHTPFDERFLTWQDEAAGRKLRTVPLTFPDFLKTGTVLHHEYAAALTGDTGMPLDERRRRVLAAVENGEEIEACMSLQALSDFADGHGPWRGLPASARRDQLDVMARAVEELYPTLRLHLYDMARTWSAPFTVFGRSRVALYLGPAYLLLNGSDQIRHFIRRFDEIVRIAAVQPHAVAAHLIELRAQAGDAPAPVE